MNVLIKRRMQPMEALAFIGLIGLLWGLFPAVAHAEDNSSTVPGNAAYTEDAFYYSDQYMWKASLFVAKSDTVNKDSSSMNNFYRIGDQAVYLNPVKNMNQWAGGSRPSNISGLFFSKENKVDTLMELQSKGGDVNALDPIQITSGGGVNMITGLSDLPYVPQLSDGDIYDNGVIYGNTVGNITAVASYFNSKTVLDELLHFYANKQGVTPQELVQSLQFTIDGETRTDWNPEGILPDAINDNPTNQVEWLVVYEPVSIVYVKDTAHAGSYYGYALTATDFAVSQIKHQMDWRYDETRWTAWAGQQPDAWKANVDRQHVSRLAFLLMGNSVITKNTWYGLEAGTGVDQNAAIPFNRWFSDQQAKYGGWGMSRWIKPASYEKPRNNDYRPNTDVVLSTPVYSNINATPGSELTVTYKINGEVIGTDSLVAPMKTESYSYLKWHTPSVDTVTSYDLEMSISPYPEGTINCGGNEYTHRTVTIRPLSESTPPDPKVDDKMPTDLPKDLVAPSTVSSEDTVDETAAPVVKSVTAVTSAPYYKNETVKIEVVTNRATKNLNFTNVDSGAGKQFGSDSLGDGMLISRNENVLANEIVWTIEFVPANFGANHYQFMSISSEAGQSEPYVFDVNVVEDPDIPIINDVLISPIQALYTLYEEVVNTPLTYDVYFNSNGGNEIEAQSILYNTILSEPALPTKEGNTFLGWYKDQDFVYPWNFSTDRITGVTTLYAKWSTNTYTVKFDPQGGTDTYNPVSVEYGSNIEKPTPPTRANFSFLCWYHDIDCTIPWNFTSDTITGDTTIYGKWDANAFTVNFDSQGGSSIASQQADYDALITQTDPPVKDGFSFAGWYQDAGCNTIWSFTSDRVKGDLTLYARWNVNVFTITFDSLGGSVVPSQIAQYNTITTIPLEPPIRSGYSFGGWFKEDFCENTWDFWVDKVTKDTTLYAKWIADEASIEFISNNGTSVPKMVGTTDREIIDTIMPISVRDGYTMNGWFDNAAFEGDAVTTLPNKYPIGTTIYYAKWTANKSTIHFETNNGTNIADFVGVTDQEITDTAMPTSTRAGYTFSGWFDNAAFEGDAVTALPNKYPIDGVTYYAKWTANPSTIKFETNNGSIIADFVGVTDQEITDTTMPTSTRTGFAFSGWFDNAAFEGDAATVLPSKYPIGTTIYYAKWIPIKYNLIFEENGGSAVMDQQVDYDTLAANPSAPSLSGYTFTGWFKDSGLTTLWDFSNDKITEDTTLYAGWKLGIPDASIPLENWSWEQIAAVADLGQAESYFDVGEEKNITLSTGEVLTLQIYDFNHDQLADETSNKANITFGLKNLMAAQRRINPPPNTNYYGWDGSEMRGWCDGISTTFAGTSFMTGTSSLYSQLPLDLMQIVDNVNKSTFGGFNNQNTVISSDKIFLFSEKEVTGTNSTSILIEGDQYQIFINDSSQEVKSLCNGTGSTSWWWLRSPIAFDDYGYRIMTLNAGVVGNYLAASELGVNFGFAIGNAPTNTYSVSYNSNGGSAVSSSTATLNTLLTAPAEPTKDNYSLLGWYKDAGLTQKWDFSTDKVTGNTTLYAKWGAGITFDSQGGTAVSPIVVPCNTTFDAPSSPSKDGYVFKGWYKESACLSPWTFVTDMPTGNTTLYAKWQVGLPDSSVPLNNWSWDQINQVAELGLAESYFDIGETKNITLSTGEVLTLQIYDFNHDDLADGSGKSNITFGLKNLMKNGHIMDPFLTSYTNCYGWDGSDMRAYLNGIATINEAQSYSSGTYSIYSQLPSDLKPIIAAVNKYTSGGWNNQTIVTSVDDLFLFSEVELFGTSTHSVNGEGSQYSILTTNGSRVKTISGIAGWWWTRSAYYGANGQFNVVAYNGTLNNENSNIQECVNFGFCLGNAPTNQYTVSYNTNGGSIIANTTATLNTTIVAPTAPTKANAIFDSWYKDAALTVPFNFSTDKITGNTTLYAKWKTLPALGTALADCTWDQIAMVANAGLGDDYWNVGDAKDMTLSTGEVVTMQIYDFNHDDKSDGTGKTNITFGTKNLMVSKNDVNTGDINTGGWDASQLRNWMNNGSLYSQLPVDIKNDIQSVKKYASGGYYDNTIVTSVDNIFAFSEIEVFGNNNNTIAGEGYLYPIFTDNTSRIKKMNNGVSNAYAYWLRSSIYSSDFCGVSSSGLYANFESHYELGIAFGFCMGTAPQYTVSYDTQGGSAAPASQTVEIGKTITKPADPTKSGLAFTGWFKDSACTTAWDFTNDKVTASTTLYAKWITLPPVGTSLESCSWEEIAAISKAGLGDTYFNVGDEKNVTISGTSYTFQIYDFNHDDKADGTGKANITFGMKGVLIADHRMNTGSTNYYGWVGSDMRAWLNGVYTAYQSQDYTTGTTSIWSQLPAELKAQITPVKKYTSGGNSDQTLKTSNDNLYLFSEKETFGTNTYTLVGEGTQYTIFTTSASRVKTYPSNSSVCWWLRSPDYNYADGFLGVNDTGTYCNSYSANYNHAVAFGFSI